MPITINDHGRGNVCRLDPDRFNDGAELSIRGNDNIVEIGPLIDLRGPRIHIKGDGNLIRLATGPAEIEEPAIESLRPFLLQRDTRAPEIAILGNRNRIEAGHHNELYDSSLQIVGERNTLRLGSRVKAHMRVDFDTTGGLFEVGDGTTCVAMQAALHEPRAIRLGKDCQLAADIYITVSDTHPIIDIETGARINHGRDVSIGDHVWLCYRTVILKGSIIGSGSIVGTCSVVTGEIPENCCVVGNPARVARENVTWARELGELRHARAAG